jgi:hypothetical protein
MLVAHRSEEHSIHTCILCSSVSFPSRKEYTAHLSRLEASAQRTEVTLARNVLGNAFAVFGDIVEDQHLCVVVHKYIYRNVCFTIIAPVE